ESYDARLLRAAIRRELFKIEDERTYTQNPMTYAGALNVLIYVKRDFAPFEERVQSLIRILQEAPNIFAAARNNLDAELPRPFVETAIEVAQGSVDFLGKDLVEALRDLKDKALRQQFQIADKRAIRELRDYVKWLKKSKLPKAHDHYALGREKYSK